MEKIYLKNLWEECNKTEIINSFIKNDKLELDFIFNSDFKFSKILRDFIEVSWKIFGISEKNLSRIILVCDELNNNAIEHGSDETGENHFRIKLEKSEEKIFLNIEVEDNWKWKDAASALEMETLRAHQLKKWYDSHASIRWRWLFLIIVKIVDRLYFKDSIDWGLIVGIKKIFENEKTC